jgi:hypothetical protein
MILYLAKRARPELVTAVSYLATRLTKCDGDDVDKLIRLIRYIRGTRHMGMILRPGASGIRVHLFVDAPIRGCDGRSHSGSCVVIGDLGGAGGIIGLSESGALPSEFPVTTGVQHAGSHNVPG